MAERSTNAPHLTRPAPNPYNTPHTTSIPDDFETDFTPTPLHSPGGPQYEDLPPSYDFVLSDAHNGVASIDASQIEAHRVSANEGPDEPEVWEYRMRGEGTEEFLENEGEHEEAPAYEEHVPIQHVGRSESIPVGRVGDPDIPSTAGNRGNRETSDPPHSVHCSRLGSSPSYEVSSDSKSRREEPRSLSSTPSNGPFGHSRQYDLSFRGIGRGSPGRGCGGHGARSGSSQDWAALGQNLGKTSEESGRQTDSLGEQFGPQARVLGEQPGRQTEATRRQLGRDAGARAMGHSGGVVAAQNTHAAGPSNEDRIEVPADDGPPSYQRSAGTAAQETSVLNSDCKVDTYPSEKTPEKTTEKTLNNSKAGSYGEDDDDDSSTSDYSSSLSSSSESEGDDYNSVQAAYLRRIASIDTTTELAYSKGKKPAEEIARERDLAIAKATREKEVKELEVAQKRSRRTQKRDFRMRRRTLTREYRQKKKDLREQEEGQGKGKGKAKGRKEWKELKSSYKVKERALKRERLDAKREWKREKREGKRVMKEDAGEQSQIESRAHVLQ